MVLQTAEDVAGWLRRASHTQWQLATLAAVVESGLVGSLVQPGSAEEHARRAGVPVEVVRRMLDVLVNVGLAVRDGDRVAATSGLATFAAGDAALGLFHDLRSGVLQSGAFVAAARAGTLGRGWDHTDPEILESQGRSGGVGAGGAIAMFTRLFTSLPGLFGRLKGPEGAVLDVGTGVGAIAIRLATAFPLLKVVALEPQEAPRALARRNVDAAGLTLRIELRAQLVQDLTDEAAFDAAWLPLPFLPASVFEAGLRTVHRALRPGGYLLTATLSRSGDAPDAVLSRLRTVLWGGDVVPADEVATRLVAAGYTDVTQGAPGPLTVITGRRPE